MSVLFDPGFSSLTVDLWSIAYVIENDLQSMNQLPRKIRYYNASFPKIHKALLNNIAFYKFCMGWAYYVMKNCPDEVIEGNPFENLPEEEKSQYAPCDGIDFLIEYIDKFQSDAKYYHVKNAVIPENSKDMLKTYREFIAINEGFTDVKKVSDLKAVKNMEFSVSPDKIRSLIDKAVETKDLSVLLSL